MSDWVVLALLRRARGIKGEIYAESLGSRLERFQPGLEVTISRPGSTSRREARIEQCWSHNGKMVLQFTGIETRDEAEKLTGCEIQIPEEDRPSAPEGEHYLSDLIGYRMLTQEGRELGQVTAWYDNGGPALLEVEGKLLVPFVPAICIEVNRKERQITAQLPEGLEELNA